MNKAEIQLVDAQDRPIGTQGKLEAHQLGLLHRAFSVFIWRQTKEGVELLLHRRALTKYHSGGLWTNSCCSHPRPNEPVVAAAKRRLQEELGLSKQGELVEHGYFIYQAKVGELIEYELDHVLSMQLESVELSPDPDEVCDWCWQSLEALRKELHSDPEHFTCWLPLALEQFLPTADTKNRA